MDALSGVARRRYNPTAQFLGARLECFDSPLGRRSGHTRLSLEECLLAPNTCSVDFNLSLFEASCKL